MRITHDHFVELALKSNELEVYDKYHQSIFKFVFGVSLVALYLIAAAPAMLAGHSPPHILSPEESLTMVVFIPLSFFEVECFIGLYFSLTSALDLMDCWSILKEFKKANPGNYK